MTEEELAKTEAIIASFWSTGDLQAFALNWRVTEEARDQLRKAHPESPWSFSWCWEIISSTQEDARDYYKVTLADASDEERRWEAAAALTWGGWDIHKINFRKS